jgi:signal transduction histidine kinase
VKGPGAQHTPRTALSLYAVLLVLPTIVLGYLQWHHLVRERDNELSEVPHDAEDAALRFRKVVQEELDKLIAFESRRPLEHYSRYYQPDAKGGDSTLLESPLLTDARPNEIQAWFAFDLSNPAERRTQTFFGGTALLDVDRERLQRAAEDLGQRFLESPWMRRSVPIARGTEALALPVRAIAINAMGVSDEDCLNANQMLLDDPVHIVIGAFSLLFYRESDGTPRLVAHRQVVAEAVPQLVGKSDCLQRISSGRSLVHGFFLDPQWFFDALPLTVAANVLTKRERFLREGETCCGDGNEYQAAVHLIGDLGFETGSEVDATFEKVRIAIDTQDIRARFRGRAWRFFGVATMLALALGTGVFLLGRSVRKDLEQAQRTENFVAAVTHELRTPLSAIRIHGEMLQDGWVKDPAKQLEYYRRIVRETERLSTLVERVLEKAKLGSGAAQPEAGSLCTEVQRHVERLHGWRTTDEPDLAFDLPEGLPDVMLTAESVASILVNLIENARKYAPVDPARPGAEPIRVVLRLHGRGVALEVQDRGPGVAESERKRIFEAFYRVGSEATRTARGTGLGLHLVALQADSVGAVAEVEARPGGGAIFRVTFARAPGEPAAS